MKNKLMSLLPYVLVLLANYYLLPLFVENTGAAMLVMLGVIPLITFICSAVYGMRQGFDFLLPVAATILFVPSLFIYYNDTAWPYVIAYGMISLVGTLVGKVFYKKR